MRRSEPESDLELVAACLRGEADAWESLVRRYASLVYTVTRRYGLDDDDAADVFQNTWSTLWERLPELRNRERLGAWLVTVAGRLSYQVVERHQRQESRGALDSYLLPMPDPRSEPEALAIARAEADEVRLAIERLPDRCRQLLGYLFYDPATPSYAEIAGRLGVSPDTVGPLRGRCLRQLRTLLEAAEND